MLINKHLLAARSAVNNTYTMQLLFASQRRQYGIFDKLFKKQQAQQAAETPSNSNKVA
jgi:hypothetical protein